MFVPILYTSILKKKQFIFYVKKLYTYFLEHLIIDYFNTIIYINTR